MSVLYKPKCEGNSYLLHKNKLIAQKGVKSLLGSTHKVVVNAEVAVGISAESGNKLTQNKLPFKLILNTYRK